MAQTHPDELRKVAERAADLTTRVSAIARDRLSGNALAALTDPEIATSLSRNLDVIEAIEARTSI